MSARRPETKIPDLSWCILPYPGVIVAAERDVLNFVSVVDVITMLHVPYLNLLSIEVSCHLFILAMGILLQLLVVYLIRLPTLRVCLACVKT